MNYSYIYCIIRIGGDNMFGDRLSELLDEKNISQKDFAKALNIAPSTLNGYIRNRRQPDFELVKTIADVLSVSTDCLLEYTGGESFTAKELALISKLRMLSPEQREIISELIELSYKKTK